LSHPRAPLFFNFFFYSSSSSSSSSSSLSSVLFFLHISFHSLYCNISLSFLSISHLPNFTPSQPFLTPILYALYVSKKNPGRSVAPLAPQLKRSKQQHDKAAITPTKKRSIYKQQHDKAGQHNGHKEKKH
jgi:hypothetical protein